VKKIAVAILVLAALVWASWLIAVPSSMIETEVEEKLKRGRISADLVGFRKGLFLGFKSEALDVMNSGQRFFSIEDLRGGLKLIQSLRSIGAVVALNGKAGGGEFEGTFRVRKRSYGLDMTISGADIEELGLFEHTGFKGSGTLDAEAHIADNAGDIKFSITGARLSPFEISGRSVPMDLFHTVRGALVTKGRAVDVKSVTLEGKGLFARASGTINAGILDMTLELMPEPETDTIISVIAGRYKVSDGLYRIPVRRKVEF
jgi:type II secretion system protein N